MFLTKHRLIGRYILALLFVSQGIAAQVFWDASFSLPANAVSAQTVDVQRADMDNDGDIDIILANEYQPNNLLINNGVGLFIESTPGAIPQEVHDSEDIGIADFNKDGLQDIVFVSEDDFKHEYYLNTGGNNFSFTQFLPFTSCNAVVAADFNSDGYPDIFLGNRGQNFILINDGTGQMINETPFRLPNLYDLTHDVKALDIEGDGDQDLIIGNENVNILLVNNNGVFTDESNLRIPQGLPIDTRKLITGDIDNDGDTDLFLATVEFSLGKDPQNRLWVNDGNGYFTDVTFNQLPIIADQALDGVFCDLDRDDDLDLVISGVINRPVKFYINNGGGYFQDATDAVLGGGNFFPDSIDAFAIIDGDFNSDGFIDLYIANRSKPDHLLIRNPNARIVLQTNTSTIKDQSSEIQSAPNPSNGLFRLSNIPSDFQGQPYSLYGTNGQLIFHDRFPGNLSNHFSLDLRELQLPAGIYFLQSKASQNNFNTKIIIGQ